MDDAAHERWWRADAVFMEALERPPEDRAAFLAEACAGDADLRGEVDRLLNAHGAANRFLDRPVLAGLEPPGPPEPASREGQTLGRYRLLREIGHGGMGTVFLAERADGQFRQQVALKLVRSGLHTRDALRRFWLERQILARLQHPHIARLLDGGLSPDGVPYFVMEFVEGLPVTDYADAHTLPVEDRLALFCTICEAVAYAHRNLVVHRDLKPTNMLVDRDGRVKLLDFGIAKLLDREAFGASVLPSETQGRVMTPEYASPEQVRGEAITTASDVYQLGLLFYELVAGRSPYRLARRTLHEVERVILEEEPEKPSQVLLREEAGPGPDETRPRPTAASIARARSTQPEKLWRRLAGDLDTIGLKALKKEPERRYGSAMELAEDVRRHLDGRPVRARRDTAGYRVSKFVRRHRAGVAAAGLIVLSLAAGVVATSLQAREARVQAEAARREAARANRINDFLQEMLASADPSNQGRDVRVVEVLAAAAAKVEAELNEEPGVAAAVQSTLGVTYHSLGLYEEAMPLLKRALDVRRRLYGPEHPEVAESLHAWAGLVHARGDYAAADSLYRAALDQRRRLLGPAHPDVALSLHALARTLRFRGDYAAAEPLYREALALQRKLLGAEHPDVAVGLNSLASLLQAMGRYDEAEPLYREALAMKRNLLGAEHPDVANTLNDLALLMDVQGDYAAADSLYRAALDQRRRLLGPEHPDVAATLNNLALLLHATGAYPEAERLFREALALQRRTLGPEHPAVAAGLNNLALLLHTTNRYEEAERLYREALALDRRLLGEHPDVALDLNNLAALLQDRGEYGEAERLAREALALQRNLLGPEHPGVAVGLHNLATMMEERGAHAAADSLFRQALALARTALPGQHPHTASILVGLGVLLGDRGDPQAAEPLLQEALEIRRAVLPAGHLKTALAEIALGGCLTGLERYAEAERLLVPAYRVVRDAQGEAHPDTRRARERLLKLYEAWGKPEKAAPYRPPPGRGTGAASGA